MSENIKPKSDSFLTEEAKELIQNLLDIDKDKPTIEVDDTLSVQGMAADALATGNAIANIHVPEPSDEQIAEAVSDWLDEHPEATSTVEDGSITYEKLNQEVSGDITGLKSALGEFKETTAITSTTELSPNQKGLGVMEHDVNISRLDGMDDIFDDIIVADGLNIFDFSDMSPVTTNGVTATPLANNAFILNGTATHVILPSFRKTFTDSDMHYVANEKVVIKVWATAPIRILFRAVTGKYDQSELRDTTINASNLNKIVTLTGTARDVVSNGADIIFASTSGTVFNNAIVWLGVYHEGTTFETIGEKTSLPMNYKTKMPTLNTMYYMSQTTFVEKTKDYVDRLDIDINDKLTYVTPEKFYGGIIPNTVDASSYIRQAIEYGNQNKVPIFCGGNYATNNPIEVECSNISLFLNNIDYKGTSGYALQITGRRNIIKIEYIKSSSHGFAFVTKSSSKTCSSNRLTIATAICDGDCITFTKSDDAVSIVGGYTSYNNIHISYGYSTNGNIIKITSGSGGNENHIYGGEVGTKNSYVIYDAVGGNYYYDFCLEVESYSGICAYNGRFTNFRATELINAIGEDTTENRRFLKLLGSGYPFVFIGGDVKQPTGIDLSEHTMPPVDEGSSASGYLYGIKMRNPIVVVHGHVNTRNKQDYYTSHRQYYCMSGDWSMDWRGRIIYKLCKPNAMTVTDSVLDMNNNTESDYFLIGANCTINLSPSYCPDGISEIYVKQNEYSAIIYDSDNNVVFDGTNKGEGLYKIKFIAELHEYHPSTTNPNYTESTLIYGACGLPVVEKLTIV